MKYVWYFYISNFHSMSAVPKMAIFCSSCLLLLLLLLLLQPFRLPIVCAVEPERLINKYRIKLHY